MAIRVEGLLHVVLERRRPRDHKEEGDAELCVVSSCSSSSIPRGDRRTPMTNANRMKTPCRQPSQPQSFALVHCPTRSFRSRSFVCRRLAFSLFASSADQSAPIAGSSVR